MFYQDVPGCGLLCVYTVWGLLAFMELCVIVFRRLGKFSAIISSNNFSISSHPRTSVTSGVSTSDHLVLSWESLRHCLFICREPVPVSVSECPLPSPGVADLFFRSIWSGDAVLCIFCLFQIFRIFSFTHYIHVFLRIRCITMIVI